MIRDAGYGHKIMTQSVVSIWLSRKLMLLNFSRSSWLLAHKHENAQMQYSSSLGQDNCVSDIDFSQQPAAV